MVAISNASSSVRTPSTYQADAIDCFLTSNCNLLIDAVAGSGKTTLLKMLCERLTPIQRRGTRVVAFSREIVNVIKDKLPPGVYACTSHSLGRKALQNFLKPSDPDNWVNARKYNTLAAYYSGTHGLDQQKKRDEIEECLMTLATFARLTLTDPKDPAALEALCSHFDVTVPDEAQPFVFTAVADMIEWGRTGVAVTGKTGLQYGMSTMIDFTDMVYLPCVLEGITFQPLQLLLVDEAQDLSAAHRRLYRLILGRTGRLVAVGDMHQAIMGFAGADCQSLSRIAEEFDCKRLPLSICYRCGSMHLDLIRPIVSHIEAAPNAIEGELYSVPTNRVVEHVRPGDMILCRTTAPLIARCYELLNADIPAVVKGRDIGDQLKRVVMDIAGQRSYKWEEFGDLLETYCEAKIKNLKLKEGKEMQVQGWEDKWQSLASLHEKAVLQGAASAEDLCEHIDRLFGKEKGGQVLLSTIHRAKGLEARRIWIEKYNLLPHPMARTDWQVEQEYNLKYVAGTRAMDVEYFIDENPGEKIVRMRAVNGNLVPYDAAGQPTQPALPIEEDILPTTPPAPLQMQGEDPFGCDDLFEVKSGMTIRDRDTGRVLTVGDFNPKSRRWDLLTLGGDGAEATDAAIMSDYDVLFGHEDTPGFAWNTGILEAAPWDYEEEESKPEPIYQEQREAPSLAERQWYEQRHLVLSILLEGQRTGHEAEAIETVIGLLTSLSEEFKLAC